MSADQAAYAIYLGLFGVVIAIGYLAANRGRLGQTLQQAAIWGFIFIGVVLVYGIWDDIERTLVPRQSMAVDGESVMIDVPRARNGHYYLTMEVNGAPIRFVIDTGATDLVLTQEDAARAGIDVDSLRYFGRAMTANGPVETAEIRLETVGLGAFVDRDVRAVVNAGEMGQSLLGMSYLGAFGRIEIEDERLRLVR
ncbi:retropepsin-like aspartic protease family protein [Jannaschia ovalis]|uniref:TIGR02281 family clan AA aspartic protease n=1 Tax=Jannaschia ovalis TaxID=3038773 RepID=A0ABY8LCE3_9RHOB|nr:TIGR02281 family clan AA aspartic protease [Jannaschia sp. GRR-S6-38]WGH79000.1 TIGR02281 family clan AA aspartic protease [Jannaschia sp. GRR-S6-38]